MLGHKLANQEEKLLSIGGSPVARFKGAMSCLVACRFFASFFGFVGQKI